MSKQTAIRLPDETFARIQNLAAKTGRTTSYYIREAIDEHLNDIEDIYLAENAIAQLKRGEDEIVSSKDFWCGLAD